MLAITFAWDLGELVLYFCPYDFLAMYVIGQLVGDFLEDVVFKFEFHRVDIILASCLSLYNSHT